MASRAFRSVRIRNCYSVIVLAAELCGIVRASYLSPSFPFPLCFEFWQYLRWRQPKGDHAGAATHSRRLRNKEISSNAGFPSALHLLRGAAFAVTLMLPAEGWAQGAPAVPSVSAAPVSQQGAAAQQDGASSGYGAIFPRTKVKTGATSADVLKQEERQRILGVVPNFNTVETSGGVPSLSPRQKFHLMYKSSIDPFVFVADGFVAGLSQAREY